jgi:hypothetical protein
LADMKTRWFRYLPILMCLFCLTSGCTGKTDSTETEVSPIQTVPQLISKTAAGVVNPTDSVDINTTPSPEPVPTSRGAYSIWVSSSLPNNLRENIILPSGFQSQNNSDVADLLLNIHAGPGKSQSTFQVSWRYILVAPFPTVEDGVNLDEIRKAWKGDETAVFMGKTILVSEDTKKVFDALWGTASSQDIQVIDAGKMLETAWRDRSTWALIPFEALEPRWKALYIDGQSPLDKKSTSYPLTVTFELTGNEAVLEDMKKKGGEHILPEPNYDSTRLSTLVLTGTTALVRYTALRMEEKGITYPAQDILNWFQDADLLHISNEVPLFDGCPPARPLRLEARFCSSPSYIELFKTMGVDLIELTGNHELDWGEDAFRKTLDLYKQKGFRYYGGGTNLEEARQPLLWDMHNGNKLAIIGCNMMGPEPDWATEKRAGSASCDLDWMTKQIQNLAAEGYLPIVTFQHFEVCDYLPQSLQRIDFAKMAQAGAVIVSGSQSHCPQGMTFATKDSESSFIHYGLGNLYFDQMDGASRRGFLDRHVFYDGRYISTELLTTMLEDYARPRPMTTAERIKFLKAVFNASEW